MQIDFYINILLPIFYLICGLLVGSFLSVCIYRIPLGRTKGADSLGLNDEEVEIEKNSEVSIEFEKSGEKRTVSFFEPKWSLCPACGQFLKWWMNIPLFSWFFLMGKCNFCKTSIPFRYPLLELLSGIFCFLSFTGFENIPTAVVVYLFACAMIVISFIDIDYYIIPNIIIFPAMLIALALVFINQFSENIIFLAPISKDLLTSLYGFICGGGFLWLISGLYWVLRRKEGLGFGDVKLMALVGILFGPQAALVGIFLGSILGSIMGAILLSFGKSNLEKPLPFGPFLALGSLTYIYLNTTFPILTNLFYF